MDTRQAATARASAPVGETASPPVLAPRAAYPMALEGQGGNLILLCVFTGLAGVVFALIGHPIAALAWTAANWGVDWGLRRQLLSWRATAGADDPEEGLRRLGWVILLRNALAFSAPAIVAAIAPRLADTVFVLVLAGGYLVLAVLHSLISRRLVWMGATPALAAMACAMVGAMKQPSDFALVGVAVWLGAILWLLDQGTVKTKADWEAAEAEKNDLLASMTSARDDAHRASQAKSTFLATMSHEIRTPMNGVLGMAQLLKRSKLNRQQTQQIDTIIQSGEFLLAILNDILDLSKIDAGRMEISTTPTELRRVLQGMVELWRPRAEERRLTLTLNIAPEAPEWVAVDALRLRQILFNLIGNALKFTEKGGVAVGVHAQGLADGRTMVTFQVADTGVGIAPDALPVLFQRFSQVDDSDVRRFGGTGLGLAVCKQLAELMGGDVVVESTLGRGSTFSVRLPLDLAEDIRPAAVEARVAEANDDDADHDGPLRILATDDNPTNLLVLDHLLHALGHAVVKAASGAEAVERLAAEPFDLVLMDIQMPKMSGVDVLKAVRAVPGPNRGTPLIALTADALTGDRERYLALGFSDHVTKPIMVPCLVEAMAQAAAGREAAKAA